MASKKQEYYVKKFNLCDRNHFWILKGIAILAALIAVFCQSFLKIGNSGPITHMAATVFVMCSGFGVSESFLKKKGLVHYWENKLIKVWIPSVVILIVLNIIETGNIASWIATSPLGFKGNLLYVIFGGYAAFWLIFQLADNKSVRLVGLFAIAAAAFVLIPESMSIRVCIFAFPVGVLLSQVGWKRAVSKAGWGIRILALAICLILAVGCWFLADILVIPYVHELIYSVSCISVAIALMLATFYLQKIQIWGVFVPFGIISYGLYLTYNGVFAMFTGKGNIEMYAVLVIVVLAVATAVTVLRELLISWNYKMRRKGSAHLKGSMG